MVIIQLDSEQLSSVIQKAVRKALAEIPAHPPQGEDQLLTVQEAADFLSLSVPTIYGYVHRQEIPFNKLSKRLYFSQKELTEWIKGGRKKTISEIEDEAIAYIQGNKKGGKR